LNWRKNGGRHFAVQCCGLVSLTWWVGKIQEKKKQNQRRLVKKFDSVRKKTITPAARQSQQALSLSKKLVVVIL